MQFGQMVKNVLLVLQAVANNFFISFIASCKMSAVSEIQKNDNNKVNFKITGSKETGIQINN